MQPNPNQPPELQGPHGNPAIEDRPPGHALAHSCSPGSHRRSPQTVLPSSTSEPRLTLFSRLRKSLFTLQTKP